MQNNLLLQYLQQLRTSLFHAELQLQHTEPQDTEKWNSALENMQQVLKRCAACAAFAEAHLYPLAETYEPAVVDHLRQHQRTIGAYHLATAIAQFPHPSLQQERNVAALKLRDAFDTVVLGHMQYLMRLQQHLLPVINRYHSTDLVQQTVLHLNKDLRNQTNAGQCHYEKSETSFRSRIFQAEQELTNSMIMHMGSKHNPLPMHY